MTRDARDKRPIEYLLTGVSEAEAEAEFESEAANSNVCCSSHMMIRTRSRHLRHWHAYGSGECRVATWLKSVAPQPTTANQNTHGR